LTNAAVLVAAIVVGVRPRKIEGVN
jgi:hypothetical protein